MEEIVLGFVGECPEALAHKFKLRGNAQNPCFDCLHGLEHIEVYHDDIEHVVYIWFESPLEIIKFANSLVVSEILSMVPEKFHTWLEKNEVTHFQSLLLLFHICHHLVIFQPTAHLDVSMIHTLQAIQTARDMLGFGNAAVGGSQDALLSFPATVSAVDFPVPTLNFGLCLPSLCFYPADVISRTRLLTGSHTRLHLLLTRFGLISSDDGTATVGETQLPTGDSLPGSSIIIISRNCSNISSNTALSDFPVGENSLDMLCSPAPSSSSTATTIVNNNNKTNHMYHAGRATARGDLERYVPRGAAGSGASRYVKILHIHICPVICPKQGQYLIN
jgi:hypothetical protein